MVISQEKNDVVIGGALETSIFTIKAFAKAFQIFSANLYSNPLGSMIRELSTNAYDAHVMVGKPDLPFSIKLPNTLEPSFIIRDYGPGLSESDINTIYTTFFESTKTNSNDVVGCLGLGSKSPFGVTDSFTINSYYNGTKTIYSAFLNQDRIPSCAKFHSCPTDEPNGLEIEVAIKASDINVFASEVNDQLKYFKTKPIITGNSAFSWNMPETYIYEGTGWKMTTNYHSRDARVIQGQIAYPINTNAMGAAYSDAEPAIKQLLSKSVLFEVNIGDVNIAPSREALSYDQTTNDNIIKTAEKILRELPAIIAKTVDDAPTEWNARITFNTIMSNIGNGSFSNYNSFTSNASGLGKVIIDSGAILWKNKDVSSLSILLREKNISKIKSFYRDYNKKFKHSNYYTSYDHYNEFKGKKQDEDKFWHINARKLESLVVVFATDTDKNVEARAKYYVSNNCNSDTQIIIIYSKVPYSRIKRELGIPELYKASDLPKIPRTPSAKKSHITIPVQKYYSSWHKSSQWRTIDVQDNLLSLSGYYINLERFDALVTTSGGVKCVELKRYFDAAVSLGIVDIDDNVYGLRKTNQKRPHKLIDFFDHCKKFISSNTQFKTLKIPIEHNVSDFLYRNGVSDLINFVESSSPMYEFLQLLTTNKYAKNLQNWDVKHLFQLLEFENNEELQIDISELSAVLEKRYTIIPLLNTYELKQSQCIANYIKQMDILAAKEE